MATFSVLSMNGDNRAHISHQRYPMCPACSCSAECWQVDSQFSTHGILQVIADLGSWWPVEVVARVLGCGHLCLPQLFVVPLCCTWAWKEGRLSESRVDPRVWLQNTTKPTVAWHYSSQVTALLLPKAVTHQWYNCACWCLGRCGRSTPGTGGLSVCEHQAGARCEGMEKQVIQK